MSVSRVLFTVGNFPIHLFGVMVALGLLVGIYIAIKMAEKKGISKELVADVMLYMLLGGMIGARLLFVLQNLNYYWQNPISILFLHQGGLSIHGALLGGAAVVFVFSRIHKLSFLKLADSFVLGFAIGYAIGRIGCDIYGNVTSVPWAVTVDGVTRHPVQLYSALAGYLIFILLVEWSKKQHFSGEIFLLFVTSYSVYRFVIEFFRSTAFSNAQYLSIITAAGGILFLFIMRKSAAIS